MPRNRAEKPKIIWKGKPVLSYYGRDERPIVGVTHSGKFKAGWTFKDIGKDESGRGHIDGGMYYEGEFSHWRSEQFGSKYQAKEWAKLSLVADFHKGKAREELTPASPKKQPSVSEPEPKADVFSIPPVPAPPVSNSHLPRPATNAQNGNRELAQTKKLLGEIGTVKAKPPEKPSKSRVSPDR